MQMDPQESVDEAHKRLWEQRNFTLFMFLFELGDRVPKPYSELYDGEVRFVWKAKNVGVVTLQMTGPWGEKPRRLVVAIHGTQLGNRTSEHPHPDEVISLINTLFVVEARLKAEGKL